MTENVPLGFDRLRWKDPRWSRWAFRNTASFLPTSTIAPAANPRPLVRGESWQPDGWESFLVTTHATSAIVVAGGRIIAEAPANVADDRRPHMLFSITKSVVGLTARILIDAGTIDPDQPASHYLAGLADTAFGDATLTELLAMRDGVAFDEDYAEPTAEIHHYSRGYWGDVPDGARGRLATLPKRPRKDGFAYRTPAADVAGAILSAATNSDLANLVGEVLWRPMGAAHQAHFILDTAGVAIAGAGLNATTADLTRLALLLLHGGTWSSRQIIPERVVAQLFEGGDRVAFARGHLGRAGWSYCDLWWHMGHRTIAALGVHGQRLLIDADRGIALIKTAAQPQPDNSPLDAVHAAWLNKIALP